MTKNNRYEVTVKIGVNAKDTTEAKAKIKAMLTTGSYNGKIIAFNPGAHLNDMRVKQLAF